MSLPFPTLNTKFSQHQPASFKISFQTPTPNAPTTFLVLHPYSSWPYFATNTCFQRASLSEANLQIHLPSNALFTRVSFLIPSPPFSLSPHTISQLTRWAFLSKFPSSPPKKNLFAVFLISLPQKWAFERGTSDTLTC